MGKYIKESEIEEKIAEINTLNSNLEEYTAQFTTHINEIQDLLVGLKVCLNTTGGVRRLKELTNIEYNTATLNDTISKINSININYTKHRENLNEIIIDVPPR